MKQLINKGLIKRILSLLLTTALLAGLFPAGALAADQEPSGTGAVGKIITFDPLEKEIALQTLVLGSGQSNLLLPDKLDVIVEQEAADSSSSRRRKDKEQTKLSETDIEGTMPDEAESVGGEAQPTDSESTDGAEQPKEQEQADETRQAKAAVSGREMKPGNQSTTATLSVPVREWGSQPDFEPDTIGTYVFTPELDQQWELEAGAEPPSITVQVVMGIMPLAHGDLTITGDSSGYTYAGGVLTITQSGNYTISMAVPGTTTTDNRIIVNNNVTADITLNGVSIDVNAMSRTCAFQISGTSTVNLTLQGSNKLISGSYRPGIEVIDGATLTITAADIFQTLEAEGGDSAAGIGGSGGPTNDTSCGTVTINNGTIHAQGGKQGTGIGGGSGVTVGNGGVVTINGGVVTANGGTGSAGIGGGSGNASYYGGHGGIVKINGGVVTAVGKGGGAGIGGGGGADGKGSGRGGTITITGGIVTAEGGNGAGIGGGNGIAAVNDNGNSGDIKISGGTITATATTGAAVGTGRLGGGVAPGGSVTITGGSISTTSNTYRINPPPTNGSDSLYLNTLTVGSPAIADDTPVSNIEYDAASSYGSKDVVAMNGGAIYIWLPHNSDTAAQVSVDADGDTYAKTWARTATTETETLLRSGNAEIPSITSHPQDAVYDVGNTATPLSVTAGVTDGGILSYQWYENTSNSTTGGTAIAGAVTASYMPDTDAVGTRYYYCQVTNTNPSVTQTATETSNTATITVNALVHAETPSISAHPQDAVYDMGNAATPLSVTAGVTDGGILSYQWYENTSNSTTGGTAIAGAVTASYTPDTDVVGSRYYYCQVTNTNTGVSGTQTATESSNAAEVIVKALVHAETPSISDHPQDAVYDMGNAAAPLSVTAGVTDGGILSYQWYENTSNSTTGGTAIAGAVTTDYTPDTDAVGTRYYYCLVTNTNTGVSGTQTATETSNAAEVTVNARRGSSSRSNSKSPETNGTIRVYNVSIPYTMNSDTGVLSIDLTASLLNEIAAAAGDNRTIAVNVASPLGLKEIAVDFPPVWFLTHTEVTFEMQSDVGGIFLNQALAEKFPEQNTAAIVSLRTGSLTLSAKQNGNEITWDQPNSPVTIYMPYTPVKDVDTNSIVMYDKITGRITAHSFYADGKVYGAVAKPGQYEVKVAVTEFADVAGHWASADIAYVTSHDLISGTTATAFSPDRSITRADFLTALVKLSGADTSSFRTSSFSDVANGSDTMPYIEWAYENKIVEGIGGSRFGPDQLVTREQMAVIMVNYAKAINLTLPELEQAETFADSDSISAWAEDAVEVIQRAGIIAGKPDNRFDPAGSMTRAEASVILRLFAERIINDK